MGRIKEYARNVRDAQRRLDEAQADVDDDYARRRRDGGPWGEDETYLALNAKAYDARLARDRAVRGK